MPPSKHALLSASSSHRWLNCNPSARLEQEFADRETEAAAEGTAAHALCEHKLITTRWQHVIDKNGLILSSAKNVLLNNSKLSTALNEAKQHGGCAYRTIELHVQEIAE